MARITGKQLATHLQLTGSLSISGSLYGDGSNLTGIGVPAGTISSSAQVISSLPAGTISGSSQLPSGIISGSTQLSYGIISSSAQFDTLTLPFTGSFTGSFIGDGSSLTLLPAQTENDFTTALKNKLDAIEASADVTDAANVLANLPNGVISGSSQLPSGLVSGSTQLPLGLISGSAQVIAHLPAGTISGSIQVSHDDTTGFVANEHIDWTTDQGATNIHPGNYTDTNTTYSITDGELSENNFTTTLKNKLDAIEASADVTDATNVLANLPAGIISGSAQISITESQISDLGLYLTSVPAGTISGSSQMLTNLVGSDLVVKTITAEEYVVSSSVTHMTTSFSSGSTIFGDDILDTHQFTGSLYVSGSLYGDGSNLTGVGGAAGTISSSAQLPSGIISSSTQFDTLTLPFTGSFTGSFAGDGSGIISLPSQTENDFTTTLKNKLDAIEASADVTDAANVLANLPSGTISGSAQLPSGIISGSTQFDTLTFPFTGSFTGSFVGDGTGITGISGASDENFTTTLKNKLDAIEASADVTDAANVLANLPSGVISGSTQFDTITLPFTGSFTGSFAGDGSGITGISGASDENFTTALKNKLDGIEASADVTDAANVLANLPSGVISGSAQVDYTSISNVSSGLISGSSQFNTLTLPFTGSFTGSFKGDGSALISLPTQTENDFTTTLKNKLDAIEAAADVTDATNVAAAGALMDSEVTSLALIKGLTAASISGSFTSLSSSIASDVATNTAKVTNVSTNLTKTVSGTGFSINSSDGDNVALSLADTDNWGLMSDEMFDKLDGIEASADVTDATNVLASLPSGVVSSSAQIDHDSTTNFVANEHIDWTTDQGATNIHSGNYTDTNTTYSVGDGGLSEINFTSADNSKLDGIEALADVTDAANVLANLPANIISSSAQLPSGLISGSTQFDTLTLPFTGSFTGSFAGDGSGLTSLPAQTANDFTTTLKNKLDAIEASADVTDATNVLANLPSGIISGSTQLPANIISSSAQLPSGIISGSIQFNTLTLPFTGSFTGSFVGDGSLLTSLPAQTANDFTTTLKNKLDGIEALADVTDATNVAAAGALMDSEVSALALIKGLTAASISGSFTSLSSSIASDVATNTAKVTNVSTNLSKTVSGTGFSINSSDGDNVALSLADTDNWGLMSDEMFDKLDGIEALADVTDATNVLASLVGTELVVKSIQHNYTSKFIGNPYDNLIY
jgi:trimeric autotransporter adhesin